MRIVGITDDISKQQIARDILESLSDWFGIPETREAYISDSAGRIFFSAEADGQHVGFLYLKPTGRDTIELAVMGVKQAFHRQGIGRRLFESAKAAACEQGYSFMQVKTVQMGIYEDYDQTNRFYLSVGFREFEVFPTLWDENNPCQVYVMSLS